MNFQKILAGLIVMSVFALIPSLGFAQISSNAGTVVPTEYSSGPQDNIHIFCGSKGETSASLTATSPNGESASFQWLKYNNATGTFDQYLNDQSESTTSTISNLADGCYRVIVTSNSAVNTYTAWAFNNFIEATAEIPRSDCDSFTLTGNVNSPTVFQYVDLSTGQPKNLDKGVEANWLQGSDMVSKYPTTTVYSPPTKDTDYTFRVSDAFGCVLNVDVRYISIVTKAAFSYTEQDQKGLPADKKEAPLTVTFTNNSENGDPGKYQWFIFKDRDEIIKEAEANPGKPVDSIMTIIYSDSPIYIFEKPGSYRVKLVSQKLSEFNTCYDTTYIDKYIVIDESFIQAPNFFSPNGDDNNDKFIVQFISMKTMKITIVNRWGKVVHVWESNNVQGFGVTKESVPQSVWDGKIGGNMATPGVYYYVAEGVGRDGKKRSANGFFHLFRGK